MYQKFVFKKPDFGPPPKGYIAGLGRGATGFITRSDLGPAQIPNNAKIAEAEVDPDAAMNDNKYDQWSGYQGALFAKNIMDQQDRQAEQAYDYCQRKMDQRRSKQRQQRMKKQYQKYQNPDIPINEKFKDLKRQLAKVTMEQWENIPQSVDSSLKKRTKQKYVPVPDSFMVNFLTNNTGNTISQEQNQTNKDYRQAKQTLLKSKLNQIEQKQSSVDRVGYLTQLNTNKIDPSMIGDISKARLLLKSAMQSNPKNVDIWISAARVQQLDGKLNDARQILKKGVANCPFNQDIWIELSRVERFQNSKNVIIEGLKNIPTSQKLWIYAAKLQGQDKQMKSKILRKGLQNNSSSVRLWKQLIEIQQIQQAKKLLYKAVQYIPKQIDLWLALSKIQTYQNAKKILNMARKANPLSETIWINAAKLQQTKFLSEQQNQNNLSSRQKQVQKIQSILLKARQILKKNGKNVSRDQWIQQAFYCQKSLNFITCEALVKMSLSYGLNQQQILNTLIKDTKIFQQQRGLVQTVRYLYRHGLTLLKDKMLYEKYISFQQRIQKKKQQEIIQSTQVSSSQPKQQNIDLKSQLLQALKLGNKLFPQQKKIWLMTIQKYIKQKKYDIAQKIIKSSEKYVSQELLEQIKLEKVKILKLQHKLMEAKCQLQILCEIYPKGKSKIQLINLQYQMKNYQKAWELCENFYKELHVEELWILSFKILIKLNKSVQAKTLIEKASLLFPNAIKIWKIWIQFQIDNNNIGRARSILDKALLKNPKQEELFLIGFQIQYVYGSIKDAIFFLSKAIKSCPKSAQLWGKAVQIQPIATRKKKASVAIQNCGASSALLNCSIAKIFWKQNKIDKAKKWIASSLELQRLNGDIWCLYLLFLKQNFAMEYKIIWQEFIKSDISEGRIWKQIVDKDSNLSKEQIYNHVSNKLQSQFLRIN